MEGVNTNCELKRISPWNKEAQIITITIHPSIFYTHFVLHSGPVNVLFALTFKMWYFILAHIRDTQRNPFSLSCNVCINAYSERIRDQIPANKWWPMDFVYVKRRCCCWQHGQTENLGRWGSLRENKSWATFTGLCAINNGRSLGEPRGTSEPRDLRWCVLRCWWRAWQTVREREDSGGSQWCRWPFHRVSQLRSAGGGAAASPTPRCSHRGQFKVSSIHLLLFHRWTWLRSLPLWLRTEKATEEKYQKSADTAVRLIHLRKCWTIVQRPAMLGSGNEHKEERGMRERYESYRKMCTDLRNSCAAPH